VSDLRATSLGYSLVDQFFDTVSDWASAAPYWVLFVIAGVLIALFVVSLVKKLVVISIVLAILLVGACALWFYSGSTVGLS